MFSTQLENCIPIYACSRTIPPCDSVGLSFMDAQNFTTQFRLLTTLYRKAIKNTAVKGENAGIHSVFILY